MRRDWVLLALFMSVPYAFIQSGIIHTGHLFFFLLSALVVVALMQKNIWLSFFFIYVAIWQLFNFIDALYSFSPESQMQARKGLSQIIYLIAGLSLYVGVLKTKLRNETVYNAICISCIAQCLLAICQMFNYDPVLYVLTQFVLARRQLDHSAITGTLGNPNFLVAYLAISLPFFFRRKWCYFIPVMAILFYLSKTSAAVVPALMAVPFYYWNAKLPLLQFNLFRRKFSFRSKWLIVFGGCLAAMGYAVYDGNIFVYTEVNQRYQLWWEVLQQFKSVKGWLFGFGPGAIWAHKFPMHNEWLTLLHSYGLIGLIFIAGFIKSIDRSNRILFAAFGVICINMIGNYPLHLAPSVFLIIIIVGLMQRGNDVEPEYSLSRLRHITGRRIQRSSPVPR